MRERLLRVSAVALALAGAGVMGYLLYVRHTGGAPTCLGSGCATVQRSRYAEIFGMPVAAFGLAGYVTILVLALRESERARLAQATVSLAAFAFSAYLLFVQVRLIGALCEWCLVGDLLTTGLAAIALLRLGLTPARAARTRGARVASSRPSPR